MNVYIPVIGILTFLGYYALVGLVLYIPLDLWLTSKLVKANMGMRRGTVSESAKRMVTHPFDTVKYLCLWPMVLFQIWKA